MAKFFHPSSTLDGRDKVELFKRALISLLSSAVRPSTGEIGSSLLNKTPLLPKLSRTSLDQISSALLCPCQAAAVKPVLPKVLDASTTRRGANRTLSNWGATQRRACGNLRCHLSICEQGCSHRPSYRGWQMTEDRSELNQNRSTIDYDGLTSAKSFLH